jgi:uncharacterized protein YjbI with pentapeptide repeats
MAKAAHLERLQAGYKVWSAWRHEAPKERPDLSNADLRKVNLANCDLSYADLRGVNLRGADCGGYFVGADLSGADLSDATIGCGRFEAANLANAKLYGVRARKTSFRAVDFSGAALSEAALDRADLSRARFTNTELRRTVFIRSQLNDCELAVAKLSYTIFCQSDLRGARNLQSCVHYDPSGIDWATLQRSGALPRAFLQDSGWPSDVLDYLLPLLALWHRLLVRAKVAYAGRLSTLFN